MPYEEGPGTPQPRYGAIIGPYRLVYSCADSP